MAARNPNEAQRKAQELAQEIEALELAQVKAQLKLTQARPGSALYGSKAMDYEAHAEEAMHDYARVMWGEAPTRRAPPTPVARSRPATAMSRPRSAAPATPMWKKQAALGSKELLTIGVPRASTPANKVYVTNSAREHITNQGLQIERPPPKRDYPGAQREGEQRGAGENGKFRAAGRTIINFDPVPTCEDHKLSLTKMFHTSEAVGRGPNTPDSQRFKMSLTGHDIG